jgi:YVTN family beta-propeller protein
VSVIDLVSNTVIATIPVAFRPLDLAITPDGTRVYGLGSPGSSTVSIIDTATNTVIGAIPVGFNLYSITIAPDGTRAYALSSPGQTIAVIDTSSNTVVDTITSLSCPANMAIAITPLIPKTKDDCKNGGYLRFGAPAGPFKNQGQCVSYVEHRRGGAH